MSQDRQRKIESYGNAYVYLVAALEKFPQEMWAYKPDEDTWSIHEIIVHIADSEANSFVRCRRAIAEPGKSVMAYDEMRWCTELGYERQSTHLALDVFRALRYSSYHLIRDLPESAWVRTLEHPENGTMTLEDWLNVYERHIPEHVEQMQSVYETWIGEQQGEV